MEKLTLAPDRNGYTFTDPAEVLSVQLDGGASKYRTDILNANKKLSVNWTLDRIGFNYFRSFFNVFVNKGVDPFLLELFIDDPFNATEHECHFIPGSVKLSQQSGDMFLVSAQLEVKPVSMDQTNLDYAAIYGAFGNQIEVYDDLFDNLVTYEFGMDLA